MAVKTRKVVFIENLNHFLEIIRAVPEGGLAQDRGVAAVQPLANHGAEVAADPVKSPLLLPRSIPFLRHPIYGTPLYGTLAHNYCVAI